MDLPLLVHPQVASKVRVPIRARLDLLDVHWLLAGRVVALDVVALLDVVRVWLVDDRRLDMMALVLVQAVLWLALDCKLGQSNNIRRRRHRMHQIEHRRVLLLGRDMGFADVYIGLYCLFRKRC